MIVDLFAGPGGWDEGLRLLGHDELCVGIELDEWACATRAAAGHPTIRADVASWPLWPLRGRLTGLIGSPPCTAFSQAGGREGAAEVPWLIEQIHARNWTGHYASRPSLDPLVWLVLEPGRWIEALHPEWVALEQVPPVLPLWRAYQHALGELGYSSWAGVLNAADYGVPQTRERAFLIARRDERAVLPPEPTHSDQRKATDLFGLEPWVSMAEALGWFGNDTPARTVAGDRSPRWAYPNDPSGRHGRALVGFPRRDDRGTSEDGYRERDMRGTDEPAFALTEKARSWVVKMPGGENGTERSVTEPAPTVAFGHDAAAAVFVNTGRDWKEGGDRGDAQRIPLSEPAPVVDATGRWFLERPATTVAGDTRIQPPGHKQNSNDPPGKYDGRAGARAIRVEVEDALVLQSFPRDYPLQGSKTKRFEQVGNAVPPLLAAHVISVLAGDGRPSC